MKKSYNIEQVEAQSWCLKNNHIIYAVPVDRSHVKIVIHLNGRKPKVGEIIFKQDGGGAEDPKWWERIAELYLYFRQNPPK